MKKKVIIILIIVLIVILSIVGGCIYIDYKNIERYSDLGNYYLCGGTYCKNSSEISGQAISYNKCEMCGKKMEFQNTNVDALCSSCSYASKHCKHCKTALTDEQIEENEKKQKQIDKYNKIGIDAKKIAYIDGSNYVILLAKNTDKNLDEYKNKLVIVNMKDYSIKKEINIKEDYIENTNIENARLEYDNGIVMLFNEEIKNSFVFNIENEIFKEIEYKKEEQEGRTYYYVKDLESDRKYYYFPEYDIVLKNPKTIDWNNYYVTNPDRYIKNNFCDVQVLYKDNEKIAIAYYKEIYGDVTLELFTKNGNKMELSELISSNPNAQKIVLTNKNMVLCYNIKEQKEVWSYDLSLKNKLHE